MLINTNLPAIYAQRNLDKVQQEITKNTQRLSSGLRINTASDDAAGLGIANTIRAETRAFRQAARNAEQANSMLQIMEGGVTSVGSIVERMKELATQGGSDNVSAADRTKIIDELIQLQQEIDRIVDTTKFQGSHLLKTTNRTVATSANAALTAKAALLGGDLASDGSEGDTQTAFTFGENVQSGTYTLQTFGGIVRMTRNDGAFQDVAVADGAGTANFSDFGITLNVAASYDSADGATSFTGAEAFTLAVTTGSGGDRKFLVSSSADYSGQDLIELKAVNMDTVSLGIDSSAANFAAVRDNATGAHFQSWLTKIDAALVKVNAGLGSIGAAQNRLGFATESAKTAIDNFTAAESAIRDVNMAEEMAEFSTNQILQNAGIAMLTQANSAPQSVLKLLG